MVGMDARSAVDRQVRQSSAPVDLSEVAGGRDELNPRNRLLCARSEHGKEREFENASTEVPGLHEASGLLNRTRAGAAPALTFCARRQCVGSPEDATGQELSGYAARRAADRRATSPETLAPRRWIGGDEKLARAAASEPAAGGRGHTPGDLLDAAFAGGRAPDDSYGAYLRYRDGGHHARDLDHAVLAALPLIGGVCRTRDRALVGAAACAIFRAIKEGRFTEGGASRYQTYLRHTARGAVAHEREAEQRFRQVDHVGPEVCWDGMSVTGHVLSIDDVERALVIEKIPVLIAQDVVDRLRFGGEERRTCLYILQQLVTGRDVPPRGLADLFDLPQYRLRFLVDYVSIRCRIAFRRIRGDLRIVAADGLGWMGNISMTAWLYGESDDD